MNAVHKLDTTAFRQKRTLWLLLMIFPSLILDVMILYRIATHSPVVLDAWGSLDIKEILTLFFGNALLFKSEGIIIYFVMKSFGKQGEVRVSSKKVVYRRKRVIGYSDDYNYRIFIEYHITAPESVTRKNNGDIVIKGDMDVVYLQRDKEVHSKGKKSRCVIPGYYAEMDEIMKKLERLAAAAMPDTASVSES